MKGYSNLFKNKDGQYFKEDNYHNDHYEVYKNQKDFEKGKRQEARYWNGSKRNLNNDGHNCCWLNIKPIFEYQFYSKNYEAQCAYILFSRWYKLN